LIYIGDGSIQLPVKINHPAFFGTDICKVCIGGGFPDVLYIDINRLPPIHFSLMGVNKESVVSRFTFYLCVESGGFYSVIC
jgi:hypothetical protein